MQFCDASCGSSNFTISLMDCLNAVYKARNAGFFDFNDFDAEEYEYYERVESGDLNWIVPHKFVAFCGPHNRSKIDNGYPCHAPETYFNYFRQNNVSTIIRLNLKLYNGSRFVNAGFDHKELFFTDGSKPSDPILKEFLQICEEANGAIAVHCKGMLLSIVESCLCCSFNRFWLDHNSNTRGLETNLWCFCFLVQLFQLVLVEQAVWLELISWNIIDSAHAKQSHGYGFADPDLWLDINSNGLKSKLEIVVGEYIFLMMMILINSKRSIRRLLTVDSLCLCVFCLVNKLNFGMRGLLFTKGKRATKWSAMISAFTVLNNERSPNQCSEVRSHWIEQFQSCPQIANNTKIPSHHPHYSKRNGTIV